MAALVSMVAALAGCSPVTDRWLVLECDFSQFPPTTAVDAGLALNPAILDLDAFAALFAGESNLGAAGIVDSALKLRPGGVIVETDVRGWYAVPYDSDAPTDRFARVQQCTNAALKQQLGDHFDFSGYWGILQVSNWPGDSGLCSADEGGGPYGRIRMDVTYPDGRVQALHVGCLVVDPTAVSLLGTTQ
jgi:hypothetical protein